MANRPRRHRKLIGTIITRVYLDENDNLESDYEISMPENMKTLESLLSAAERNYAKATALLGIERVIDHFSFIMNPEARYTMDADEKRSTK